MKKETTKLISILLTLVMLLSLLPMAALAAEQEKETIPSISATVTLPTAGAHPVETGTPGGSSYEIRKVSFSEKDPETGIYTSLESTDTFEAGKTYMVNVLFRANSGYAIDRNTVSASINGQNAAWWSTISDGWDSQYFYIEYTVPEDVPATKTPITSVKVSDITEPVAGATPDFDITLTGDGVVFDEEEYPDGVAWYKVNMNGEFVEWVPMDEGTEFGAGLYELRVALKSEAEYEFTDATKFYYNEYELPAWHDTYESNYDWWADEGVDILLYFTVEESATPTEITNLSATVTEPVAGASPSFEAVAGGEGYTAEVEWESEDAQLYPEDGYEFKAGEKYYLYVAFNAKEGCEFADDVTITINGDTPEDIFEHEGKIVALVTYTLPAPTPTYTVSFDANGGSGTMADVPGVFGEYTLPVNGFAAPDGKQFKGWAISPDGAVISGTSIGVSANTTLYAIWEDIPAAPTATIVVMKWDSNQQPLAGATFTLTLPGSIQPAHTAVSDANGLVTFTDVADGSYTLAESEAPAGYVINDDTWSFVVRNGAVSDATGTPYDNNNPLTVINDIVPAPQTATIVVMKWDSNQQPLAGATFTLTLPGSIEPAYTAVSGADGLVTFTDVADGSYTLAESEAPAGYVINDDTWSFVVRNGAVSDATGTPYDNNNPLTVINEPVPAPELPDIVVWKTDGGQNYVAGATFTLTKERATTPVYTATSDENGKVLFEDVADGIYILAETAAPAGYIPTDLIYKFIVEDGTVYLDENDDPMVYEGRLSIVNEPIVTFTLPITKVVAKGGTSAPGQQTFTFEIKKFGNDNFDVAAATIIENTITTNGVGSFDGGLKFSLAARDAEGILSEGLIIVEKNDGAANWTYDANEWEAFANYSRATSGGQWVFRNDDIAPNGAEKATFTNIYSYTPYIPNPTPDPEPDPTPSKPVLNKEDHAAFMQGYVDGTFGPTRNMVRGEVAAMFARLLTEKMEVGATYTNSFSDVSEDIWCYNYIGYMEKFGLITGYADGTFRPDAPITRAEFAAIACRFEELTRGEAQFSDVDESYWAYDYINFAAARGWVTGYEDDTFRPNDFITREEVVAVTCRLLERSADQNYVKAHPADLKRTYSDISESDWSYWFIVEASNGHDYTKNNGTETWVGLMD